MSTQATHSKNSQGLHNVDPPKWLGLVTDVVLWIFLFFLFSLLLYIFVIRPQQASQQTVSLTFKDANEVSRGALVRMMGTDIGYVDNIRINKEKVNIVVKTEPGGITIPENSTFTVNFTGLVGAKSIEVIPPNNPTTGREQRQGKFFLEEPIRFRDAQKYQIDIAKALQSGAENFADFFGKQQPIPVLQKNIHKAEVITAHVNDMMREADRTVKTRGAEVHSGLSKIGHVVEDFSISSRAVAKSTGQNDFGPNVLSVLAKLSKGVLRGQRDMAAFVHERHLQRYQHTAAQMNEALMRLRYR